MALIELANKLPRITLPTKLANDNTVVPWTTDPYLETTVGGSPWSSMGAVAAKRGIVFNTGLSTQNILHQNITLGNPCKGYLEVEDVYGVLRLYLGGALPLISQKGNYIIDDIINGSTALVQLYESFFIYDSYFKSLIPGNVPQLGPLAYESWGTDSVAGSIVKQSNGNVALNMDYAAGNSRLIWKTQWAATMAVVVNIDVLYLPVGGELAVIGAGGSAALVITAPGSYQVDVTMDAGENLIISNNTQVQGSALITKFMAKRKTQTWTVDGKPSAKITALWAAGSSYFDRIINPTTVYASARFDKPSLNGFVPSPGQPLLGYGSIPPPSGQFRVGDTVRNNNAIAGAVSGWRCIAAGNPGTWMPLATL